MNRLLRWGFWAVAPCLAGLVAWGAWKGVAQARRSREELQTLQARREYLVRANLELRREVGSLQHEKTARERAAREALDVVAPGEVLVIVPEARAVGRTDGAAVGRSL